MLLITDKLRGKSLERLFELSRGVRGGWGGVGPDPSKQSTKAFCNSSVHPKGVIRVEFCFKYSCCGCNLSILSALPEPAERTNEVLAEFLCMCQTLEGGVHEASVSPIMNENSNEGVGRWSHIFPSPSVPGSGARFDDVGVLLFQRDILEDVAVAGLASSVLDPKLLVCIFPKKSLPDPKSGAGVWFCGALSDGHWPSFWNSTAKQSPLSTHSVSNKSSVSFHSLGFGLSSFNFDTSYEAFSGTSETDQTRKGVSGTSKSEWIALRRSFTVAVAEIVIL